MSIIGGVHYQRFYCIIQCIISIELLAYSAYCTYISIEISLLYVVLTAKGLLDHLMSEENNVLDLASLDQYMDMNKPLNHYFVNSSHNTYLNGM